MNKGELIAKIAEAGLSKKDAGVALNAAMLLLPLSVMRWPRENPFS